MSTRVFLIRHGATVFNDTSHYDHDTIPAVPAGRLSKWWAAGE